MPFLTALLLGGTLLPTAEAADYPRAKYELKLDPYDIGIVDYNFPSGMRVIFQADHNQPVVAVTVAIDRGSEADPVGLEGIAHVAEHMVFKAKHGDLPKNWDLLPELGATINASTSMDWTNYMTVAPKDALIPLLKIEALRMLDGVANVSQEELVTEIEVVRNELRMRYENAAIGEAWDALATMMFPVGHPYNRTTIGSHQSLSNIDIQDIRDFVKTNYTPSNTTIVVVGDIDLQKTGDIIQQAFGEYPSLLADPKKPDAPIALIEPPKRVDCSKREEAPPLVEQGPKRVKGMVEKETVVVAWSMPGGYCGDEPAYYIVANQLTNAIYRTLVPDWQWSQADAEIPGIGCFADTNQFASRIICYAEPTSGYSGERLVEKIGDALYLLWDREQMTNEYVRPYIDWSYGRARSSYMASIFSAVDDVASLGGRATALAMYTHFTGSPRYFSDSFNQLNSVDPVVTQSIAAKYLLRDKMASVIVEPIDANERARREAAAKAVGGGGVRWEGASADTSLKSFYNVKEMTPEATRDMMVIPDAQRIKTFTLSNGMRVNLMPYGEAPLVRANLRLNGGSGHNTLDALANALESRGQKLEQNENPLAVAGFYGESAGATGATLSVDGSSANLDALMHQLRSRVGDFDFAPADKAPTLRSWESDTKKEGKDPEPWASRLAMARLFPNHPMGAWRDPAWFEVANSTSFDTLKTWTLTKYQPANAELTIVGKMNADEAEKVVRAYFEGWSKPAGAGEPISRSLALPSGKPDRQVLIFDKPIATQSDVTVMCQLAPLDASNNAARLVLANALSDMLFRRLREQAGITYGAYAYSQAWAGGIGMLAMSGLFQNDGVGFALQTMFEFEERAAKAGLDDAAVIKSRWNIAREYVIGQTSTDQMLNRLSGMRDLGYDFNYFSTLRDTLSTVDQSQFPKLMEPCVGHEVVTIVGPKQYAEEQLTKLGIKYEVVDWDALHTATLTEKEKKEKAKKKAKEAEKKAKEDAAKAGGK